MIGLFSGNTLLFGPLKFKAIFDAKMFRDYPQVMLNFIASKSFFNFKVCIIFSFLNLTCAWVLEGLVTNFYMWMMTYFGRDGIPPWLGTPLINVSLYKLILRNKLSKAKVSYHVERPPLFSLAINILAAQQSC